MSGVPLSALSRLYKRVGVCEKDAHMSCITSPAHLRIISHNINEAV